MKKNKLFVYSLIFRIIIDWIYINSISPLYSYSGLTLNPNYSKIIISYIFQIIVILLMGSSKRPSNYLYYFFILFTVTPTLSYYGLNNQSNIYVIYFILSTLLVGLLIRINFQSLKSIAIDAELLIKIIFYFYIIISLYLFILRGGIDIRSFDFDTVYELRRESKISGINGYLINWCTKAFSPFFYVYYDFYKKRPKQIIVVIIQLLLYLSFGNKAFLFSIFAVIGISIVMRFRIPEKSFTIAMSITLLFSDLVDKYLGFDSLRRGLQYRMFFIPSQIQFQYFDFFKNRDKLLFSETTIGKIFNLDSGYGLPIPILISKIFSGNPNNISYSNTGIFSDAYSNMGFWGMIFFAILFGSALLLVDISSDRVPVYVTVSAFSYIIFVINDTSFLTTFITGGFGLMVCLLYIMNCQIEQEEED